MPFTESKLAQWILFNFKPNHKLDISCISTQFGNAHCTQYHKYKQDGRKTWNSYTKKKQFSPDCKLVGYLYPYANISRFFSFLCL